MKYMIQMNYLTYNLFSSSFLNKINYFHGNISRIISEITPNNI